MAILAENLYEKLTKKEKQLYDGVLGMGGFKQKYEQNPDSPTVTQDPNYEKFKAVADAQAAVPEKGFIGAVVDALNPFSSAEASDRAVIDEGLRKFFESQLSDIQTDPTDLFPQTTGINTTDRFFVEQTPLGPTIVDNPNYVDTRSSTLDEFGVGSLDAFQRLIDAEAAEQAPVAMRTVDPLRSLIPQVSGFVGPQFRGVGSLNVGGFDKLGTAGTDMKFDKPTGIARLRDFLPFGDRSLIGAGLNIVRDLIPKSDPRTIAMQNFYGRRFGLTDTGQVASGPLKGLNPVSGGLLNAITGGRFGNEKTIGLERAILDKIKTRTSKTTQDRLGQTGADKVKFAKDTKKLIDLGRQQGGAGFERAFERQTRAKDLDRMRGGVGR